MNADTVRLLEFLYPPKSVFRIPVYQRKYEWTEEQIDQFFHNLEKVAIDDEIEGHFLGTIVFVKTSFPSMGNDYIIIDGQQRITTTFLLLKGLYDLIQDENIKMDIWETYFENRNVSDQYRYKLISVDDDKRDFLDLLIHNISDKPSKIHMNYKRLVYLIQHSEATIEQLYEALQNIRIVYIELEQGKKDENPQVIFESLNSTGLSLTESDLIRNYLLMNELPETQEHLYNNYWLKIEELLTNAKISDFVRHYLTKKTSVIPNKKRVYQGFKQYMESKDIYSEDILKDLLKFSRFYQMFLNPNVEDKEIENYLTVISHLRSTVTYPYLLRVFNKYYEEKTMDTEEFLNILNVITSYLVRRSIVNFPTNALNKVFSILGREADKHQSSEVEAITEYLLTRTGSAIFPRNEILMESISNEDIYNRNRRLSKLVLSQIETHSHKERIDFEESTIEHILPEKLTPGWRVELGDQAFDDHKLFKDVLGNLTLTNYNSELSNRLFDEKKEYYKDSNVSITRMIYDYDVWNKESIIDRGKKLFEKINRIWPVPKGEEYLQKQEDILSDTFYSLYEPITVTGMKPVELLITDDEYSITAWKQALITYLEWLADFDMEQYLELPKQKSFQKLLSYTGEMFRKPEKVLTIYVETNLSAQGIYNYMSSLAEFYNMENDVYIRIKS